MRRVLTLVLLLLTMGWTTHAWADDAYKAASKLVQRGETEAALKMIDEALAASPKSLDLLLLRGHVLLKMRDWEGALAAYQTFLDAGAKGGNRREVVKIMADLAAVRTTSLEIRVDNGPANVYLDSRLYGVFCVAAPTCKKGVLPGDYKVILERDGFERTYVAVSAPANGNAPVVKTLVEKPSALAITVADELPGVIAVDGKEVGAAPKTVNVPAGAHEITVTLAGHAVAHEKIEAHLGAAVAAKITLLELLPVTVTPQGATITVDGAPAVRDGGALAVTRGEHKLRASAPAFHERELVVPAGARDPVTLTLDPVGALVSVNGAPAGAEVVVDGKPVGLVPLATVEVPPGDHTVEVRKPGFLPFRASAKLAGNAPAEVRVTNMRSTGRPKMWIAAAVAGAGMATGVVFGLLANGKQGDFTNRASMAGVVGPTDATAAGLRDDGNRFAVIADVGFVAAVLAAGVGTYFFLKEGKGLSEGEIRASVGPGSVALTGRF
jgi:hypothetical protein